MLSLSPEAIFIAIGTPTLENGEADLSYVELAAEEIADSINGYKVIVEKSTSQFLRAIPLPPYCCAMAYDESCSMSFPIQSFCVRVRELPTFCIRTESLSEPKAKEAFTLLERIYRPLTSGQYYKSLFSVRGGRSHSRPAPLLRTSAKSAELLKHASNAFLATKISFINSIANICDAVNADISEVAQGMSMDPSIGPGFLAAGLGYGGTSIPDNIRYLRAIGSRTGAEF